MKRILSGIKPTGAPHLGNYFGMMKPAIELQSQGEAYYFIADYHALTTVRIYMNDAAVAVASFTSQMVAPILTGKGYAPINKPLDRFSGMSDRKARCSRVIEVSASRERICNMVLNRVRAIQNGGNATLRPAGGRIYKSALAG